jgi:asparagine synthase (glutamine-hydrolysing)
LLSGGLDSSLLVALLAEIGVQNFHTFSVGFEDQPEEKGSEFEYSDLVVDRYQPIHHKFLVPNEDVLKRLPEAVDAMAEPMFGQDAVAFYLLSEQVSQHIKVVQSGQGADEVFGGYFWYPRMRAETEGSRLERFRKHYFDRDHAEMARMLTAAYQVGDVTGDYIANRLDDGLSDEFIDAILKLDTTTLIVDDPVKRVDNMTMAWGLEARVPFLDHQLVEVAARCPADLKLREPKYLLKAISRGIVPDAVIDRPKGYFPMPALKYVRGDFLNFMRDILNSQACRERGVFQRDFIDMLLDAPEMHHTRIMGSKLWHLALLEFWLQRNVDAA